jgi:hypothetical protein
MEYKKEIKLGVCESCFYKTTRDIRGNERNYVASKTNGETRIWIPRDKDIERISKNPSSTFRFREDKILRIEKNLVEIEVTIISLFFRPESIVPRARIEKAGDLVFGTIEDDGCLHLFELEKSNETITTDHSSLIVTRVNMEIPPRADDSRRIHYSARLHRK